MKKIGVLVIVLLIVASLTACKSDDYKEAMELYANREYEAALAIFTELGDYENSISMADKCRYAQAHLMMGKGMYEDACAVFESLDDYEDSAELILECRYRQAVALMESKRYEEAEKIFVMLGDYKDSAAYAGGMGWYLFADYIAQQGELAPDNLLYDHEGVITVDSGCLCVEIGNGFFSAEAVIAPGSSKADLHATMDIRIGYYEIRDKASTKWNIAEYQKGDLISWDDYDHYFSGKTAMGTYTSADTRDTLSGETGANQITALADCIQKGIEESGLDISMADIGFVSY